jgi:hypothetical protein
MPKSRPACATDTPRSPISFTASILNSRLNLRLDITTSGFMKHLISVSIKPAAAQVKRSQVAFEYEVSAEPNVLSGGFMRGSDAAGLGRWLTFTSLLSHARLVIAIDVAR